MTGERFIEAEMYRLRGQVLQIARLSSGEAEKCFRRAHDTARAQQARLFELRAATSLSEFRIRAGPRQRSARRTPAGVRLVQRRL